MNRFLGVVEHWFWLHSQLLPIHFVLSAKISGSFSLDQLHKSLAQVQLQHSLLRVGIAVTETGHPKFVEQIALIPVRQVLRENDSDWQREVEVELSRSFDWRTAPLVRVVLLQSEQVSELIVTCHHAIADGMSAAYVMRDIVQGLESSDFELRPLSEARPIEQLIPVQEQATLPQKTALPREYPTTISSRPRPRVRTALLSAQLTQQIRDRARQENTTVHGVISAAFLWAMARQRGALLKCQTPINVRFALRSSEGSPLDPSVGETMGLYASYGLTEHHLKEDSSLWDTARSLKAQLAEPMMPTYLYELIRQTQQQIAVLPNAQTICEAMQAQQYDLIVTNLGLLPFGQQFGSLFVEAIYGPAVLTGMENEQVVGVATLGDQLSLTMSHPAPTTSEAADASLADALKLLSEAAVFPCRRSQPLFVI